MLVSTKAEAQGLKSARLLDNVIRDYALRSYNKNIRTGISHSVHLPGNLSGVSADTVRFRCGSLNRYGAQVKEFNLGAGLTIHPCVERVIIVRQRLEKNWSSLHFSNYELPGYQLVSPVLGLLAYNAGDDVDATSPFDVEILPGKNPIKIDFSKVAGSGTPAGASPSCASFGDDGKVRLTDQVSPDVCVATRQGHFWLVVETPAPEPAPSELRKRVSRGKMAFGISIGATLGAFLISLLLVAMFVRVKQKSRMEELERRAYEEEALQVTMVGHVRVPTAPASRTVPAIEHEYRERCLCKFTMGTVILGTARGE
ncbi:uncharacterized protein LOC131164356 [Malania oleifera]|uniref:uncharacterized protein LOC131164356 n=1 Tax=Malania oleifera TaxID=397392 RepID=UPI0025AE2574|nr:uncharacterized protein LOC131164356 [Malania oleifera]